MNKNLNIKLETLRNFQRKYPESHVGGSIGLLIRGIDLKRDMSNSDLDITTPSFVYDNTDKDLEERSDGNDFDFAFKVVHENSLYTKIDIRISKEDSFEVINYDGHIYNVSMLSDIIKWKTEYANKLVIKHINDLIVINGKDTYEAIIDDDLPF